MSHLLSRGEAVTRLLALVASLLLACMIVRAADVARAVGDDESRRVTVRSAPLRIVSLAPGATEMLFVAGAGSQLIATVEYSDQPVAARQVPRIGDAAGVDIERLVSLRPDVVVVWPGGGNPAQIQKLEQLGIPLYRQQLNRLADMPGSLRRLGALAGTDAAADKAAHEVEARLEQLRQRYAGGSSPTVLLQLWNRPVYTAGGPQLMTDQLQLCGARNVFADIQQLSAVVSPEAVITRNPDIIIALAPPGEGAAWLAEWKRFGSLKAIRHGLIAFEDQGFSRLGPSAIDATELLCQRIAAVSRGSY